MSDVYNKEYDDIICFIKEYKLNVDEVVYRFSRKEINQVCNYLGLRAIEGELEPQAANRLIVRICRT
jgi:hypothetical protein